MRAGPIGRDSPLERPPFGPHLADKGSAAPAINIFPGSGPRAIVHGEPLDSRGDPRLALHARSRPLGLHLAKLHYLAKPN